MVIIFHENDYIEPENSLIENVINNQDNVIVYDFSEYELPEKMTIGYCDLMQMTTVKKGK